MKAFSAWVKAIVCLKGKTIYPKKKNKQYGGEFFQKAQLFYKFRNLLVIKSYFHRLPSNLFHFKNQDASSI